MVRLWDDFGTTPPHRLAVWRCDVKPPECCYACSLEKFLICQLPNFEKATIWACFPTPDNCLQASWHFCAECHFCPKTRILMIFDQNIFKMISTSRIIARIGILDPIEFWWVPYMPQMVVPKSVPWPNGGEGGKRRFAEGDPR